MGSAVVVVLLGIETLLLLLHVGRRNRQTLFVLLLLLLCRRSTSRSLHFSFYGELDVCLFVVVESFDKRLKRGFFGFYKSEDVFKVKK